MEKDARFQLTWNLGARAIRTAVSRSNDTQHSWWVDLANKYALHPVVARIINEGVRPSDWQQLLLEWPHVSTEDAMQIAYTRDEVKGKADIQTRTSIGKYLSRHWPHVPDHVRRDWAGTFAPAKYEIRDTMEGIISGVELGPRSCMQSGFGTIPFTSADKQRLVQWQTDKSVDVSWEKHPYSVYDPALGWRMAVRTSVDAGSGVDARALVFVDATDGTKVFVRSYQRNAAGDHATSGSDEKLETWLRDQGFTKVDEWPDETPMKRIENPYVDGVMMPYIDGDTQTVREENGYMYIDSGGDLTCTNTDGSVGESGIGSCADCDDTIREYDHYIWAGRHEDRLVCDCCAHEYVYAYGSVRGRGAGYYIRSDDAVDVKGDWYDPENLPDGIVQLHDGDYAHLDDVVHIDSQGEYYLADGEDVCCTADGEWEMCKDCVVCEDGEWRLEDDCVLCEDGEVRLTAECVLCEDDGEWYERGTEPETKQMELPLGETK
jgi:hypothetical protein